ncbi:MAG: helix-turn-helix domain-containing protein [Clostridia bacterium]|nr:helix-turn-helix domain-containing protein [Clostridia bacterium]
MHQLQFSHNLKTALAESKKTQKELADYLGTTQQTVSRWLMGINEPNLETLLKICTFLNETPNTLLGFGDN